MGENRFNRNGGAISYPSPTYLFPGFLNIMDP